MASDDGPIITAAAEDSHLHKRLILPILADAAGAIRYSFRFD
jgi:hypothetical protein